MRFRICLFLFLASTVWGQAQEKPAYRIFTKEGKPVDYGTLTASFAGKDIILFGELHNNSVIHWLELQVLKTLQEREKTVTVGLEMFERDDQIVLDEYLKGTIKETHLLREAKVWDNYKTDYKPLVEFARANNMGVIATNIPRRYANLVFREGMGALETLSEEARQWIAPLPIEVDLTLPGYVEVKSMGGHGPNVNGEYMALSQAVKDATMAHFILQNRKGVLIHYHGAHHSKNFEGITWYLKKADTKVKILTIHSVEQKSIDNLDEGNRNTADFIICVPEDMTKTY